MPAYVAGTGLLATIACATLFSPGDVKGETSVWRDPGRIVEADWEGVDFSGKSHYKEMARYAAAHYESPSGFRLSVVRVLLVEKRVFNGDVKHKVTFAFARTNCTNQELFEENKCQPLHNETAGQCTAAMRQHKHKHDLTIDWVQCIDYV
ncbi:uncharacterized protein LOC144134694 [Amblyomma americanum]